MAVMTLLFLCGCSNKTNVASADLYIQVKTAQAQASAYAQAMRDSKEQLVQVLPELNDPNPQPEAKMLLFIDGFLAMNDCTKAKDPIPCYRKTRMLLINLAERYDEEAELLYGSKKTINSLRDNLGYVIDNLNTGLEVKTK